MILILKQQGVSPAFSGAYIIWNWECPEVFKFNAFSDAHAYTGEFIFPKKSWKYMANVSQGLWDFDWEADAESRDRKPLAGLLVSKGAKDSKGPKKRNGENAGGIRRNFIPEKRKGAHHEPPQTPGTSLFQSLSAELISSMKTASELPCSCRRYFHSRWSWF